jgi:hypothetical protein
MICLNLKSIRSGRYYKSRTTSPELPHCPKKRDLEIAVQLDLIKLHIHLSLPQLDHNILRNQIPVTRLQVESSAVWISSLNDLQVSNMKKQVHLTSLH